MGVVLDSRSRRRHARAGRWAWTDGVGVVVAAVSAAGRRLFVEAERDVIRTNVLGYLAGD